MTEWLVRPDPRHARSGYGVYDREGVLHDAERGTPLNGHAPESRCPQCGATVGPKEATCTKCGAKQEKRIMSVFQAGLCEHGQNRAACLTCFHKPKEVAKPAAKPVPTAAPNVIQAVKQANPLAQRVPVTAQPVHLGTTPDGQPVEKARGRMPVPVLQQGPQAAGPGGKTVSYEPYDYAKDSGRYDKNGAWRPPRRESLIDRLPRRTDT